VFVDLAFLSVGSALLSSSGMMHWAGTLTNSMAIDVAPKPVGIEKSRVMLSRQMLRPRVFGVFEQLS